MCTLGVQLGTLARGLGFEVDFIYVNVLDAYDEQVIPVWENDADTTQLSEASLVL